MLTFTDSDVRQKAASTLGADKRPLLDSIAFLPFSDLEGSVKEDVQFLKTHPLLHSSSVTGYVYDVKTVRREPPVKLIRQGAVKQIV